jgi:hypothetical protein
MAKKRNRRERRERRAPRQPVSTPLIAEKDLAELEGRRDNSFGEAAFPADRVDGLGTLSATDIYEGELEAGVNDDLPDDPDSLELLTEQELRDGETDDAYEAAEEGLTYVPPIDPPTVPGGVEGAEVASGFGVSALDEPYDADHHSSALYDDDELAARVREALRADSTTTLYADQVQISERDGRVVLRGTVDDLLDADNLVAVASYATGVAEVIDELVIRALERS